MGTQHRRYNYTQAIASGATFNFPNPTAYGHSTGDILVLDSLSCFYTASGTGGSAITTAAGGGLMKAIVFTNASSMPVLQQVTPISFQSTGAVGGATGIHYGGFIWESVDGVPLWAITGAGDTSRPDIAATSWGLRFQFTGSFGTPQSPAVEVFLSWHYESPSERR